MELKHGYYHLIAILTVAIWGLTFISTKVLINHGLTPQEIFFYRFSDCIPWHLGNFSQTSVHQ